MASEKTSITKPFSRVKNGLAELQRWWPAYVKNDGKGGLSVDPVLFRSAFGPDTREDEGGLNDESNTPGVRVEAITDAGATVSGTEPTIVISGSGGFNPRCTINHADGTSTTFMLIAPSGERKNSSHPGYGVLTEADAGDPSKTQTTGPYPVFMTVQEFAEMIDTYRHVGEGDEDKPAFLPHGLIGRTLASTAANPDVDADPRVASNDPFPSSAPYRATVFMPMMLDVNQFSKDISGASNHVCWPTGFWGSDALTGPGKDDGITRYDPDPNGDDAATIEYKRLGNSGDHLRGDNGGWSFGIDTGTVATWANNDQHADTSAAIGPKYRMRMALACFLKDGTYSLNDGALIPYTYDATRYIGGTVTDTIYAVWDGDDGYGSDQDGTAEASFTYADDRSAQIYPLFDFVQGPIAPAAQAGNFDYDLITGAHRQAQAINDNTLDYRPRWLQVRPNPKRIPVYAVELAAAPSQGLLLNIWLDVASVSGWSFTAATDGSSCIYLSGVDGALGTWVASDLPSDTKWPSKEEKASYTGVNTSSKTADFNGWWIVNGVTNLGTVDKNTIVSGATGTIDAVQLQVWVQASGTAEAAYEVSDGAYVQQGRMGKGDDFMGASEWHLGMNGNMKLATAFYTYAAGVDTPGFNIAPAGSNSGDMKPGRVTTAFRSGDDENTAQSGNVDGSRYLPLGISLRSASDDEFPLGPTRSNSGGGVLRIPPAIGYDLSDTYYTLHGTTVSGTITTDRPDVDVSGGDPSDQWPTQWLGKGVWTPLWSYMDHYTGNHAWDYIKPVGVSGTWTYGRNRPWPGHERCGTRLGYAPSLLAEAASQSVWTGASAGTETIAYGVSEVGTSPIALDLEMRAVIPVEQDRLFIMEFDGGAAHPIFGRHAMLTRTAGGDYGGGFMTTYDGTGSEFAPNDVHVSGAQFGEMIGWGDWRPIRYPVYTYDRPVVYAWSDSGFFDADKWTNGESWPLSGYSSGFGMMGDGHGKTASISAGMQTLRTFFTDAGQTLIVNGTSQGTDPNAPSTVWGLTINIADIGSYTNVPDIEGRTNTAAEKVSRQTSHNHLQIDSLVLRQIPSPPMLPFTVDSTHINVSSVGRYTGLVIEAENISTTKGMNVTVSILQPGSSSTIAGEGGAVVSGFDDVDPSFVGGVGVVDLTGLPSSVVTSGFVVRFNFYIPSTTETSLHPIDWASLPIIRSYTVEYDLKPDAALSVVGNTFNGDTSSPVDTKVGHIISFRATASTTDVDRTVVAVKFTFGDGSVTSWIDLPDQTLTSTTYDIAHAYIASGTFAASVQVKDDEGNISDASSSISIVVADASPVGVIRSVPAMVRAGSAVRFDAGDSYSPTSGVTISTYEFDFGDGSSSVSGSASSVDHTYATAGEFRATVIATDSNGNTSNTGSVVVKILPATLVVPLVLNTKPSGFQRRRSANLSVSPILDAAYPEISDTGARSDEFVLTGMFLKATANDDIEFMEELLQAGALVEFEWEDVNFSGVPTGKTFVGRLVSFDYQREGGQHGQTPYQAVFMREAGLGA